MDTHIYLPIPMKMFYDGHKLAMFMLALEYKVKTKSRCHNIYQEMQTCTRTCNNNVIMLKHC